MLWFVRTLSITVCVSFDRKGPSGFSCCAFYVFLQGLFEMFLLESVHRSVFTGSQKAALNVSIGRNCAVNRSLAGVRRLYRLRSNAAPDLQEAETRIRSSICFNYYFVLFLTCSHHSPSLWGAERSVQSPRSGWGLATRGSSLQKNSKSLWHTSRCSIIFFSPGCSHPTSFLSDLSTQGLVKWPGKSCSKHWTGQMSPESHKLFGFIKMKGLLKRAPLFCAKELLLASAKAMQYNFIPVQVFFFFWGIGFKF